MLTLERVSLVIFTFARLVFLESLLFELLLIAVIGTSAALLAVLDLDRFTLLDRPLHARLFLPLPERALALRERRLLRRDDATVLVVLQILLRETARRVVRRAVHDLHTRTDCMLVSSSLHLFILSSHIFYATPEGRTIL